MPYEYSFEETKAFDMVTDNGQYVSYTFDVRVSVKGLSKNDVRDLRKIIEDFCE